MISGRRTHLLLSMSYYLAKAVAKSFLVGVCAALVAVLLEQVIVATGIPGSDSNLLLPALLGLSLGAVTTVSHILRVAKRRSQLQQTCESRNVYVLRGRESVNGNRADTLSVALVIVVLILTGPLGVYWLFVWVGASSTLARTACAFFAAIGGLYFLQSCFSMTSVIFISRRRVQVRSLLRHRSVAASEMRSCLDLQFGILVWLKTGRLMFLWYPLGERERFIVKRAIERLIPSESPKL